MNRRQRNFFLFVLRGGFSWLRKLCGMCETIGFACYICEILKRKIYDEFISLCLTKLDTLFCDGSLLYILPITIGNPKCGTIAIHNLLSSRGPSPQVLWS